MAQDKQDGSFRVIDRRMFTEEGELRPEAQEQVRREHEEQKSAAPSSSGAAGSPAGAAASGASSKPGASPPAGSPGAAASGPQREVPVGSPHFEMLLNLVANQAAALLGAYADPRTGQAVVDLEGAREFIDMLDALREKTRGNLADEEERTLTDLIGSLKYTYMEMTKASTAARAGGAAAKPSSRR